MPIYESLDVTEENPFDFYRRRMLNETSLTKDERDLEVGKLEMMSVFEVDHGFFVVIPLEKPIGVSAYCRYFSLTGIEIGLPFKSFIYPQFAIFCPPRENTSRMTVTMKKDEIPEFTMAVVPKPSTSEPEHMLGVCLAPIYGDEPKWLMLIELIEHYKMQGATKFYIYVQKINSHDQRVLNYYQRTGELEVQYLVENDLFEASYWQVPANRDCTFRSRGRSRWNVFADLDERLIMTQGNSTLLDFLKLINDESVGAIQFRQRWVMKDQTMPRKYKGSNQIHDWMPSRRFQNTSSMGPPGHTAKYDMQRRGRPVTVTTPEAVKAVREKIRRTPERSVRKMAKEYEMSRESMRTIVKDKLKMIPYRMQKGAFLNQKNKTFRMKKARKLLAGTVVSRQFSVFISAADWPASSPDHNPMDYAVWIYLTEKVSSKNYPSIKALKTALIKKWDEIDDDYLRAVIDAYPKRLKAAIKAKGGRFENYT
ncbi:unnamed protein product [Caenorhabditis auriculariae]|uniref:Glycosyltransferase family 92 protein n=1 Tax=Caenorhabditis auriculariae TaxID=2777116 RepID=A0A8S1HUT7_9PELO|nr:unnamed protein product [Caenorhabditis auriculariae]